MRINKIQLAGLAVMLAGVTATGANAEDVTISTATTTPLSTSDPVAAAPVEAGDITVVGGGSITVTAGQTAITVDSNNDVTNGGLITSNDADNTIGILLQNGFAGNITNNGTISLLESYTPTDADSDGDLDGPFATGVNRHGVYLAPGTFTGDFVNAGVITVEGNNSSGITLDGLLDGDFTSSGTISVTGDNTVGILISGGVTGDVSVRGTNAVRGENASALVIDGDVGGELVINGSWNASGFRYPLGLPDVSNLDADDLLIGGAAVVIRGNIAGGILIDGVGVEDDEDDDGDSITTDDANDNASAAIVSNGSAPALLVETAGSDVVIGATASGFGIHVQGGITSAGVYDNIDAVAMRIQGLGGNTVTIADGVAIDGVLQTTALNANATALHIGADAFISELLVRRTLNAAVLSDNAVTVAGVVIDAGASVPSLTNSGVMRAELFGESGDAIVITDNSNTLATINNTGTIAAQISPTGDVAPITGDTIAIDVSSSSIDVTLNQTPDVPFTDEDAVDDDALTRPATTIRGDILFGSGSDTVNLLAGDIIGDISFGAGADALFIDDGAAYTGRITDLDGVLTIDVQDGTLTHAGGALNLTSANFGADSILGVTIANIALDSTFLHASGTITFAAGAEIVPIVPVGLPASGSHIFLTADGGLFGAANVTGVVTGANAPYLYNLSIDTVLGDPNSLETAYVLKTTTELGLNTSQSIAFDPILDALRQDAAAAAAFGRLSGASDFFDAYEDLMPSYAAASTELAATAIQQLQSATTNRMAHTRLSGLDEVSVWAQEIAYAVNREPSTANGQEFNGAGFGLAVGIDGPLDNGAMFGLSASFLASEAEESGRPDGEIAAWFAQGNAYLGTAFGPVDLDFVVGAGFGQMQSNRYIEIGSTFAAQTEAEWAAYEGHGAIRASVPLALSDWFIITPQAALTYVYLSEEGYTEEGGGAAFDLEADSSTSQRLWADAGVEFSTRWTMRSGGIIAPRLYLGYRANALDEAAERTFQFVSGATPFTLTDESLGDGGPLVGLGFDASNGYSTIAIGYEGEFGDQIERHSLNASIRFRF